MRKLVSMLCIVALVTTGLALTSPAAQAADTGNAAPHPGKIVSDEPGTNAPNILDGTVYSIAKVGNTIVVGGQFSQVRNFGTSTTLTRRNVLAFDATTGRVRTAFAPDPLGTVYKVLPTPDGQSAYVAGSFEAAAGRAMSSRLFKIDVNSGAVDSTFAPPTISGDIRDLEVVGNRLYIAGKFTHINGVPQKALGSLNATTGARDPYVASVVDGLHNSRPDAVTSVLQISVNKQNTRLMAVGNFTTVDAQARHQIVQLDITGAAPTVTTWNTALFTSSCSIAFETYMTDIEYSPNGQFFVVSTTGAYGGVNTSMAGTTGCDVVARFESSSTSGTSTPTWTAYTGGDTTWTVEVTDNVIYAGGHQRWQNNPTIGDQAGQGAVSREGIAALNPVNGMPYSWNPTRERGVGVQDMLATNDGLYVGSDTDLFGHTAGNLYHARIAVLPLAGGSTLPQLQTTGLPTDVYRVASAGSTLTRRSFTGTSVATATTAPSGPGWSTSTGAFMVNGVLYKTNNDGSLSRMTFDGTNYGTATAVNSSDALVVQADWHNDAKTLTSLFYANGFIYYTKSGTNALYRRGFEVESGVIGQQRFSTTVTGINASNTRGAFVANGKLYFATTGGNLYSATWNQAAHSAVAGTIVQIPGAGTGWSSRAMFPFQAVPAAQNEAPLAAATVSCDELTCTFNSAGTTDPEGDALTYDWDFGDGTTHATTANATHTYANAGERGVTLTVTDAKGATSSVTRTASPTDDPDSITFVAKTNNNGNRTNHSIAVPAGTQVGDTLLLFFTGNSTTPVYTGPSGWQQVQSQNASGAVGRLYRKTATAGDLGSTVTVTSKTTAGGDQFIKSDMTLASYRGLADEPLSASAISAQNTNNAIHQTPTVTAPDGTNWLVSFWTDKSSAATSTWAGPPSQTQRSLGTATGSSHMTSLLMDSAGRVNSGAQGGLNATSNVAAPGLTMSVLLSPANAPTGNGAPTANASQVSCVQLTCSFDGGSSTDPDADQLTYDWNWGDGTAHGTTATPTHTFTSGGNKTVTLTVSDPLGATGTATVTATPTAPPNQAPTAAITNASCTNLVCSFDGSTSSDPDTDTLTYSWDFGDSTPAATTANPSHTYAAAGDKTVTLTVDDGQGHTDTDTVTVSPSIPPNAAPTARITGVNCVDLTCSFSGATSTDPDDDSLTYSWDFGDSTPAGSGATPSHDYTVAGAKTVTLTVDDGNGHTATDTATANPADPTADPVSQVAFVGANSSNGNRLNHSTTLPGGVQAGDTLIAFFTANSTSVPITGPAGWTLLETRDGNTIAARAWTKTATATDAVAGARVTVTTSPSGTFTGYVKSDLTVAAYRGLDGTTPIAASASKTDNVAGAAHVSPAVTATDETSWLVSYWADRSTNTTGWTAPASETVREAEATTVGTAHITALLTDGNGPVASGARGQLTATANSAGVGASFSILLKSE